MNSTLENQLGHRDEELHTFLRSIVSGRWWLVGSVVLSTLALTSAAFFMTPIYRATTVLIPASSGQSSLGSLSSALGQLGGLASLAGINIGNGDSGTQEALAVMRSRQFTESFIANENLMPKLYRGKWDESLRKWRVSSDKVPTMAQAFEYFDKKIRDISEDKKTGLIILRIDWRDRIEAAEWTNDLVKRLNVEMRARATAKAVNAIGFLEDELKTTSDVGTREAINRLIESQVRQRMLATVTPEYAFGVVDPAMAPDAKDPVRPIKALFIVVGLVAGFGIGCLLALAAAAK